MKKLLMGFALIGSMLSAQTQIIAHRGFWQTGNTAQNSLESLRNAGELKVYGSEFDVRMTKDHKLVILHDPDLHDIEIAETPFKVAKKLKLKNGEKLPTLSSYLKLGKKYPDLKLILEIKPAKTPELETILVEKAIQEVEAKGVKSQTEFISFSLHICKEIVKRDPLAMVQYLGGEVSPSELKKLGIKGLDYHYNVFSKNPEWIKEAKELGMVTNSWTVNDPEVFQRLKELNIDFITTDTPDKF